MSDKNHIGPLIRQLFANAAARIAAGFKQVPQGTEVDQIDDGSIWKLGVLAGSPIDNPTPEWKLIGGGPPGADGWPPYVVSPSGDPIAPFALLSTATNAAVLAGHGPGNPAVLLVMPGTITENYTARAGISVQCWPDAADGGTTATGAVLAGTISCADEAGSFSIKGLRVEAGAGTGVTVGGAVAGKVVLLERCQINTTGASVSVTAPGSQAALRSVVARDGSVSNALVVLGNATSSLLTDDCTLTPNDASTCAAVSTLGTTTLLRTRMTGRLLADGAAALVSLDGACRIATTTQSAVRVRNGAAVTAESDFVLQHTALVVGTDYAVDSDVGGGAWNDGGVTFPSNRLIQNTVTQGPRRIALHLTRQAFAGAGPHTLTTNAAGTNLIDPGAAAVVANLPDVTKFQEGEILAAANTSTGVGTVTLDAFGAQTFGPAGLLQLLLYPGDNIELRANLTSARWDLGAAVQPRPGTVALFVNAGTGSDLNAGTAASPLATVREARLRVGARGWTRAATIDASAAALTETLGTVALLGGGGGDATTAETRPLVMLGHAAPLAGTGAIAVTARTAGTGATFGTVSYAAVAALAADGGAGYWMRFTNGPLVGERYLLATTTNVLATLVGDFSTGLPAVGNTFVIERPDSTLILSADGVVPGTGTVESWGLFAVDLRNVGTGAVISPWLRDAHLYLGACAIDDASGAAATFACVGVNGTLTAGWGSSQDGSALNPRAYMGVAVTRVLDLDAIDGRIDGDRLGYYFFAGMNNPNFLIDRGVLDVTNFYYGPGNPGGILWDRALVSIHNARVNLTLWADEGSNMELNAVTVVDNGQVIGVLYFNGSHGTLTSVKGVLAAGVGVSCFEVSNIHVTDANAGTTITGPAAANCQVGANALPSTWANINANLAAATNDLAAAVPTLCRVHK